MKVRLISGAALSLSCCLLALPYSAMAQASAAPVSNDSAPPITVQIAPPPISISSAMLGVSSPLGAQATVGKPMFAEFRTEHQQSFTDGNRISRSTTSSIYRDALGRIRRESQLSLPGMSAGVSASTFITIVDQKLGYGYVLDPQEMVAHRYELNAPGPSYVARVNAQGNGTTLLSSDPKQPDGSPASATSPAAPSSGTSHWRLHAFSSRHRPTQDPVTGPPTGVPGQLNSGFLSEDSAASVTPVMRIDQPFLAAPNPVRTENLGEQTILGFKTRGTRVITTLPAGQIGNDRPIDIVSEQWFSPDLELVMRSMHRDPWAGEFTTTVTRISRGDQPAPLFEVPGPYKVIDAANEGEHHVLDGHSNHSPGPAPW
ncbi:MAG TPA: hypothetical protein VM578_06170 [Candidatus Saccharimonadales bacterium]|nr:hypothetical protein [Candidatus Saccharimonadales bacterium]